VARLILGCGKFGGIGSAPAFFGQGESEDEAFALMDAAWELGITAFDTADAYGGGRSETPYPGRRDALGQQRPVLPQGVEDGVDVVLCVVGVRGDPQAAVALRGDDPAVVEGGYERVHVRRADADQRAVLLTLTRCGQCPAQFDSGDQAIVQLLDGSRVSAMPISCISSMPAIPA
jgi:hypothetical protein